MKAPSVKELVEHFSEYWEHDGKDPDYEAKHLRGKWMLAKDPDTVLDAVNESIDGHGVEAIRDPEAHVDNYYFNHVGLYVNMGDPYVATVVYDTELGEFHLTGWGDWLEAYEQEHGEIDGEDEEDEEDEDEEDDEDE